MLNNLIYNYIIINIVFNWLFYSTLGASLPVSMPTIDDFPSSPNNNLYATGIYVCILIIILFGLNILIDKDIAILKKYKRTLQFIYKFTMLNIVIQVILAIFDGYDRRL